MTLIIPLALTLQFGTCLFLCGLIWVIQLVHYPAFPSVREEAFAELHQLHTTRMGWIAAPAMIGELASGLVLAWGEGGVYWWLNLIGVVLLWSLTFRVSVPLHNTLAKGFHAHTASRLVASNWPRTALWSIRAIALLTYLFFLFSRG